MRPTRKFPRPVRWLVGVLMAWVGSGCALGASTPATVGVDVTVERVSSLPPAPKRGEPVTLLARVANRGTLEAQGVMVITWLVDGQTVGEVAINGLAPNEVQEARTVWTADVSGPVMLTAQVRVDGAQEDANPGNNERQLSFTVADSRACETDTQCGTGEACLLVRCVAEQNMVKVAGALW